MIPLNDLKRHYESIKPQVDAAIHRVMSSGHYIMGPEHDAFEREFAAYHHRRFAVAVANGTEALELALRALEIGPGAEVIMVANACMYAAIATLHVQAIPVFADIDPATLTMSAQALAQAISPSTRAVVVTHLYGKMADVEAIREVLRPYPHIKVLEDCSQAHGAESKGKKAGGFFDAAAFSLYPTKNLGAFGDAGVVITDSENIAELLRKMRNYGWSERYSVDIPGGRNSRMDELQAAMLRVMLPMLDDWNLRRRAIVARYRAAAAGTPLGIVHAEGSDFVAHQCVVRHKQRDIVRRYFEEQGVATGIYYPIADHHQPAMELVKFGKADLPHTELAQKEIFTLPCFPEMMDSEIECISRIIKSVP